MSTEIVKIEKLIPGGQGIGALPSGKKVFVDAVLPEEEIEISITKEKLSYAEAKITKILAKSPHRITPKDDCYLSTSPWQIMGYAYELEQKSLLLQEIFRQQDIAIAPPIIKTDGKDYFYRNKMEYSLYWDNATEDIKLAFHARGSHRKVPITSSSLEMPEIFTAAKATIEDLNARKEPARKYQSLLIRANQAGETRVALFENHKPHPQIPDLTDTILGQEYSYSPNGFFQVNLPVYEIALKDIAPHITTQRVLDLYAGVGTIGLSVARESDLKLIETNKSAYQELVKNCKNVENAQPILATAEGSLDFIQPDQTVILDPPRAGADRELIAKLADIKPKTIIYLSCNPITQARDIKPLLDHYKIAETIAYNFFPRTPHIENLVVLSRI